MRIRDFTSTLNFSITGLNNKDNNEDVRMFEKDFNHIIEETVEYIDNLIHDLYGEEADDFTDLEIIPIVLDNYDAIINESYQSNDVYSYTMKYIATKYLKSHRNEISELLKELECRDIDLEKGVVYKDDFHENLLLALASIVREHKLFCEELEEKNEQYVNEIDEFVKKYGKEMGFIKFCDKYFNSSLVPYINRKICAEYAYYKIFGIEGTDETKNPKSLMSKYKKKYNLKEYIDRYIEELEPQFRDELKESIISIVYELDHLGEIANSIDIHNIRMNRLRLSGLGYFSENNTDESLPKIQNLLNSDYLDKVDIDVLMRMNSFYNNRFAKKIDRYSKALFIIFATSSIKDLIDGELTLTKENLSQETLDTLLVKYQTLIYPIKNYYNTKQKEVLNNSEEYSKNVVELEHNPDSPIIKKQFVLNPSDYFKKVKNEWRNEYRKYFDARLSEIDNDLIKDLKLSNILYNPVFLSYSFKNKALKAEYAYMQYIAEQNPNKSFNFGAVIENNSDTDPNEKTILLASDGGVNLPNRLHTFRREFRDFVTAYTGRPLVRIYEGSKDFYVAGDYISTQLLLPTAKQHQKYLTDLQKEREAYLKYRKYLTDLAKNKVGKKVKPPKEIFSSTINPINEDFINHIKYSADRSSFMPKYQVSVTKLDKKGNPITVKAQPIRYLDLSTGEIYTLKQDGKLVTVKGKVYGQNEENIRGD